MTEYLIIKKETCSQCRGVGIYSPYADDYNEFIKAVDAWEAEWIKKGHGLTSKKLEEKEAFENSWWEEKGFLGGWPPEEMECDNCGGSGYIKKEISLPEALTELNLYKRLDDLESKTEKLKKDIYIAGNTASCLANGIIPD